MSANRYRYTGMERDEETGLAYHGARYYATWLGRWVKADPSGLKDGTNLYIYVNDKPTMLARPRWAPGNPPNIVDVITYEIRQAAFEAGKLLETGKVTAKLTGDVCLPAPKGQGVFDTIAGDRGRAWAMAHRKGIPHQQYCGKTDEELGDRVVGRVQPTIGARACFS